MMKNIDSNTELLGVIGKPIKHSLSPIIHNAIYLKENINAVYLAFEVEKENIKNFCSSSKTLKMKGFNVTMPCKEIIADLIKNKEKNVKSINTVKLLDDNSLLGTSTDGDGFLYLLKKNMIEIQNKNVLIIGGGGAASVIADTIKTKLKSLFIAGRENGRSENMAKSLNADFMDICNIDKEIEKEIDIIINATPLGMIGIKDNFKSFNFLKKMKSDSVIIDTIYSPQKTKLILEAEKLKLKTVNGLDMLLGQAYKSHSFWFNKEVSKKTEKHIEKVIKEILK